MFINLALTFYLQAYSHDSIMKSLRINCQLFLYHTIQWSLRRIDHHQVYILLIIPLFFKIIANDIIPDTIPPVRITQGVQFSGSKVNQGIPSAGKISLIVAIHVFSVKPTDFVQAILAKLFCQWFEVQSARISQIDLHFGNSTLRPRIVYYGKNVPLFRRNGYRKPGAMIP